MSKKIYLKAVLIGMSIFSFLPNRIYAKEQETKFFINGKWRWDAEIVLQKDTTYVPLRMVGEALGAQVTYDNENKHIVVAKENTVLEVNIGEIEALLNGEKFKLSNETILHTTEDRKQLVYVPLRNVFEIFDGVVDYNKAYHYVNAYNKEHVTYKALQGLKSEDLTSYRFAQLALPRVGGENMSVEGGRVSEYIFPLNKKTNYFFIRTDPSGDMDISSMAYMEIENGVALCKWYKEVRGDVAENINSLNNAINRSLGVRGITREIGEFPDLEEVNFITFTRHSMVQPDPIDESIETYKEYFNGWISLLTPQNQKTVSEHLIGETLWSPYLSEYQVSYGDGTTFYTSYYNDVLLSRVDEEKIVIK